ncbi:MAG: NUDIX domain-containing protein [Thermoleophilia bacterium]
MGRKKLWHDPVWSKVIAGIFLLSLGALYTYVMKYFGPMKDLVQEETTVPNWVFLMSPLFFLFGGFGLILLASRINGSQKSHSKTKSDDRFIDVPRIDGTNIDMVNSSNIFLKRHNVHWLHYSERTISRYWAAGTSLVTVAERNLIGNFHDQGVRDIKIILPATNHFQSSFNQLDQYNKLVSSQLVNNQVEEAKDSYKKLLLSFNFIKEDNTKDYIRQYSGIMYSNITILDDDAFIAFYDRTGVGDNSITLHFNKNQNVLEYRRVEEEFMAMWNADPAYGRIEKAKKGVSIIFINSSRQVLLFLRDNIEEIQFPNCWDLLGGNVEDNELPEKCIKREILEEIEIELGEPELFNVYDLDDRLEYTFWMDVNFDITELRLNEGQRLRWFYEEEIQSMTDQQIAFNFKSIILEFFKKFPYR